MLVREETPISWTLITVRDIGATREPVRKRLRSQPQALRLMGKDVGIRVGLKVEVGIHSKRSLGGGKEIPRSQMRQRWGWVTGHR